MVRRSRTAMLIALIAAIALVVSTGAVAWDPSSPIDALDDPASDVQLQPSSEYAYLDDAGETVIDMSASNKNFDARGLNPDAVFTFDNVTALHYDGDKHAEVWATEDVDGLTVQVDGAPIDSRNDSIWLGANETVGLDVIINTTDRETIDGTHTLRIHTILPEENSVETFGASSTDTADVDASMTITVSTPEQGVREIEIENMSDGDEIAVDDLDLALGDDGVTIEDLETTAPDDGDARLRLAAEDGPAVATVQEEAGLTPLGAVTIDQETGPEFDAVTIRGNVSTAAVPAGTVWSDLQVLQNDSGDWTPLSTTRDTTNNDTVPFEVTLDALGEYVIAAPVPDISVGSAFVENTTVPLGTNVTVEAQVANNGTAEGTETIPIRVANETVAERNVTIQPQESTEIATQVQLTEPGTVPIAVGSQIAGEVTVIALSEENDTAANETGPTNGTVTTVSGHEEGATEDQTESDTTPDGVESELIEEPAAISLSQLLGLLLSIVLGMALITLVRRVSV